MSSVIAVITGDLVGSTGHSTDEVDAAMQEIKNAATAIASWQVPTEDTRFTRFRGDGWQIALQTPHLSLRAALVIAASLRASETGLSSRYSIALGPTEKLGSRDLSDAAGPVFQMSGRALDGMPRTARVALSGHSIGDRDQIIARLMFERTSRWTAHQAEAMARYLHPDNPTLQEIGSELGISPQAVNYRLGGGGATQFRMTLQLWEELMERDLDASHD